MEPKWLEMKKPLLRTDISPSLYVETIHYLPGGYATMVMDRSAKTMATNFHQMEQEARLHHAAMVESLKARKVEMVW